jgi:YwiC-like protein
VSGRDALRPPPLPHEHGAWVMLAITAAFGLAAAPAPGPGAWVALPGLLLLFLSRYAVLTVAVRSLQGKASPRSFLVRRLGWGTVYLVLATAFVGGALALAPIPSRGIALAAAAVLLALGAGHAVLALVGRDRAAWGEIVGMAGLAAGAPFVAACGGVDRRASALAPGLLALGYFVSSVVVVRSFRGRAGRERRAAVASAAAHLAIGAFLAGAALAGLLSPWGALAFTVVLARAAWAIALPPPTLRALGMRELAVAALFAVLGVAGLRSGI